MTKKANSTTTVRFSLRDLQQLEAVAAQKNVSRHRLIKMAVSQFLAESYPGTQKAA